MIFYIRLLHSGPQACTVSLGFVGMERAQKCAPRPTQAKPGVSKGGPVPPLWHTTLLARCSVLYLPAWLTGEAGRAMRFMSCLDRQKNGAEGLPPGMRKNDGRFCRVWAGICDDINTTNMLILLRAGTFPRCSSSGNSSPWLSDSQCTFFPFTIQATSS